MSAPFPSPRPLGTLGFLPRVDVGELGPPTGELFGRFLKSAGEALAAVRVYEGAVDAAASSASAPFSLVVAAGRDVDDVGRAIKTASGDGTIRSVGDSVALSEGGSRALDEADTTSPAVVPLNIPELGLYDGPTGVGQPPRIPEPGAGEFPEPPRERPHREV